MMNKFKLTWLKVKNTFLNLKFTRNFVTNLNPTRFKGFANIVKGNGFIMSMIQYRLMLFNDFKNKFTKFSLKAFKVRGIEYYPDTTEGIRLRSMYDGLMKEQIYVIIVKHELNINTDKYAVLYTAHLLGTFTTPKAGINSDFDVFYKDVSLVWTASTVSIDFTVLPHSISNEQFTSNYDKLMLKRGTTKGKLLGPTFSGKRSYSTKINLPNQNTSEDTADKLNPVLINMGEVKGQSFLSRTLKTLLATTDEFISNEEKQREIEKLVSSDHLSYTSSKSSLVSNIDQSLLGDNMENYIDRKKEDLMVYINRIDKSLDKLSEREKIFFTEILSKLPKEFLFDIAIYQFLVIGTYRNSEHYDQYHNTPAAIAAANRMISKYFNILYKEKCVSGDIRFSEFKREWEDNHPVEAEMLNDNNESFVCTIGVKLFETLCSASMLKTLHMKSEDGKHIISIYDISDEDLIQSMSRRTIYATPTRLPMIVKPKAYTEKTYGGYLLNDVSYIEPVFIARKAYAIGSKVEAVNILYKMVNSLSSTPYKVNIELLEYLTTPLGEWLLMDMTAKHEYESLTKQTLRHKRIIAGYNSKLLLQQMILEIAGYYRNYPEIYFPVRLDQRGRLYCIPSYFNYQSNELSKSLILFANPGVIERLDEQAITYLKVYGANCFGNNMDKKSINKKCEWVDKNLIDILNYDNNKLVKQAKEPFLFLAFCLEYKRYHTFLQDENQLEFLTYLPVQLDATCNGFQHMVLLANEASLFKQLNVGSKKKVIDQINNLDAIPDNFSKPKDFYSFLLCRIQVLFQSKLNDNIDIDEKTGGSYANLNEFVWTRSHIKKIIMTMPYNASELVMKKYLLTTLFLMGKNKNIFWYTDKKPKPEDIDGETGYVKPHVFDKAMKISHVDVRLLVISITNIIFSDYHRIGKLSQYLKNVAKLFDAFNLPISWNLPSGLVITQSYLKTKTTTLSPFTYSKAKLNLKTTVKGQYDRTKMSNALMPNLIHSLDAHSLSSVCSMFMNLYPEAQLFSIHDCFGSTCEKVGNLKLLLAAVYTELYSEKQYLEMFDKNILNSISTQTKFPIEGRTITLPDNTRFELHDIDWVLNNKNVNKKKIRQIDAQHLLI